MGVDPGAFTLQTYLALVREMNAATSTRFDTETYKQADTLLTSFSKTHQAWAVTIQALSLDNLENNEYFHAANVLKNKMMYDFASLRRQDFSISFQIRDNLLIILKKMIDDGKPSFVLNCLCTALAILSMHLNESWQDMIEQLISELSNTVDQAINLLTILKYMATDCDNDSIVIEDSLRRSFFTYLDNLSQIVFEQIFNQWAQKINTQVVTENTTEDFKFQKLKSKIVDAFYQWIKLRLPDEALQNMTQQYPDLLALVFNELDNKDENLENATNCVIELISLSRKQPEKFASIREAVVEKISRLTHRVDQAVKEKDEILGEQLIDIFVELGQSHINQIIESGSLTIPEILLKLMSIPEIRNRRQVSFWKNLFKGISKIEQAEVKTQKLVVFEPVLLRLLDCIIDQMKAEDDVFDDFNYVSEFDEQFDEFNFARNDFGKLIQTICKCCGPQAIYAVFIQKLQQHIQKAQQDQTNVSEWSSIETIITCISDLATTLTIEQVGALNDIIQLVFQLPDQYVALRRAGANLFRSLSKLIKEHGMNAQQDIKKFVDYVIVGLTNKYATPSCSKAFNTLCVDNAKVLSAFSEEIIQKVIPYPANDWSVKQHYLLIVDGIGALVEQIQDNQTSSNCLKRVIESFALPLMQKIQGIQSIFDKENFQLQAKDINEGTISAISGYMQLIGDFLKGCKQLSERKVNPFVDIFQQLWTQFIERNFTMFTHIDEIVEQTVRLVKHCSRILGSEFDKYLVPFLQKAIQAYQQNPIPGFIYSVEFCLVDYHKDTSYANIFLEAFNLIVSRTGQLLTNLKQIEEFPDIAFDFFGMCVRYMKLSRDLFFKSTQLETLLQIWICGIGIEHRDALLTHTEFIIVLISMLSKSMALVQDPTNQQQILQAGISQSEVIMWDYFLKNGLSIVDKYILVILSAPSTSIVEKYVDVLVEICLRFPIDYKKFWFTQAFSKIPGDVLTDEEKERHISKIIVQNPKFDTLVSNFDIIAKRARNTVNRGN
eukprot:403333152